MAIPMEPTFGKWEWQDYPQAVTIDGLTFARAIRRQPYKGVIAQYRQAVSRDSLHLLVLEDGNWLIDHADEYNPDMGYPVRHFLLDHPAGKALILTGSGIIAMGLAVCKGYTHRNQKPGL